MKILSFSPFDPNTVSGNAVTLARIGRGLEDRGHRFRIVHVSEETTAADATAVAESDSPDVLHFYHAYKTGRLLPAMRRWPTVLTASGTDLNHDIDHPDRRAAVLSALGEADRIVTYNRSLLEFRTRAGDPSRWTLIPKGVLLGSTPFDLRAETGFPADAFVLLQAGGIRPVKNNLHALDAVSTLTDDFPALRLAFAGPILDQDYGRTFSARIEGLPWVRHLPSIPRDAMPAALRSADLLLNTSAMEGISNALVEGMAVGTVILAADVPGNRDLIEDGRTGFLYRENGLSALIRDLIPDPRRRTAVGEAAEAFARKAFSTEKEVDAVLRAYEEAIRARS